jgi:CubicO group peptidase (beta-lactamase class C family)
MIASVIAEIEGRLVSAEENGFFGSVLLAENGRLLVDRGCGEVGGTGIRAASKFWIASIREEAVASILTQPLAHEPGTHFIYSDANYQLAAAIVETVTAEKFEEFVSRELLSAAGLSRTLFLGSHSVRTTTSAAGSCCGVAPEGSRTGLAIYSAWPLMPCIAAPRPWATTCVE